jgi:formylglycine-generating enzyme required for sulfatase activity
MSRPAEDTPGFDVFVSYNSLDHVAVERIGKALEERKLTVFLDRWELVPGRPWPDALQEHLGKCRSVAVVLGPSGMGRWQHNEQLLALDRQTRDRAFGVIPVILPGADPALGFLALNTWVDLRNGVDDTAALDWLAAAVRGEAPSELTKRSQRARAEVCPYRGLEVFREEDAPFFFGRERFAEALCKKVAAQPLVAVVGPSGSGKSSVVRAGLIPSLRRLDGDTAWEVVTIVPTHEPLVALAAALLPLLEPEMTETDQMVEANKQAKHLLAGDLNLHQVIQRVIGKQSGTDRLLLVVDQWEELYTYAREEASKASERDAAPADHRGCFIDQLLIATENSPLTVVLTVRADFYGEVLAHWALSDRFQDAQVNLGPMTRDELRRAIVEPAKKVGLQFQPGLEDRLLDDVKGAPGRLPLLEFALKELWSARRGSELLHGAYTAMGGVKRAVARRAEELYNELDSAQKKAAQRVFMKLVRPGDVTGDTRRRAEMRELDGDPVGTELIRSWAGSKKRLLITGRDAGSNQETVEVAHEALILEWTRLQGWVGAVRSKLQDRARLERLAEDWKSGKGGLVAGRQLRAFRRLLNGPADPGKTAKDYLDASRRRSIRRTLLGSAAVLALVGALGGFNLWIYQEDMSPLMGVYVLAGKAGWILSQPAMVEIRPGEDDRFPGSFWMGSGEDNKAAYPDESPRHEVTFAKPFAIGRYEVTFEQYELYARLNPGVEIPGAEGWGTGDRPVINVSWEDARDYAAWLKKETGKPYRLPSEAEWEYAARAGSTGEYWWCPEVKQDCGIGPDRANCNGCESAKGLEGIGKKTLPVGWFPANEWGLYDTAGNVWEWVQDCWHEDYGGAPADGTAWMEEKGGDCGRRVLRGGSWYDGPRNLRSAYRFGGGAGYRGDDVGCRLAQDL